MDGETSLPTQLDFSTVFAASAALRDNRYNDLPLSRVLALSQVTEAIVLQDVLQIEVNETRDWLPYTDALAQTPLWKLIENGTVPIESTTHQADRSDTVVLQAADWAADSLQSIKLESLAWAVRFRHGTYGAIRSVSDTANPVAVRYMKLIHDSGDVALNQKVRRAEARLANHDISDIGLFVLMRIRILSEYFVGGGLAHYLPHYSRQPVWLAATDPVFEAKQWSMEQLRSRRSDILCVNEPEEPADPLSLALSPIFLACLARANHPREIIEHALVFRDSREARAFRSECRALIEGVHATGEEAIQRFKIRVALRLNALNEVLFERGQRKEWVRQWDALSIKGWLGWFAPIRRKVSAEKHAGDATAVFLGDILSQSLGVLRSQQKIQEVFGVEANWDTYILSCVTPRIPSRQGTT